MGLPRIGANAEAGYTTGGIIADRLQPCAEQQDAPGKILLERMSKKMGNLITDGTLYHCVQVIIGLVDPWN